MAVRVIALVLCVTALSGCDKFRAFLAAESWKWSASGVVETKRRGEVVCRAIDAYRAKTGKYPAQLSDLEPQYLQQIPQPTVGYKKWNYMLIDNGTDYWLHVVASEFGPSLDKTSREHWKYGDDHGMRDI
jgi:hypothetical protein